MTEMHAPSLYHRYHVTAFLCGEGDRQCRLSIRLGKGVAMRFRTITLLMLLLCLGCNRDEEARRKANMRSRNLSDGHISEVTQYLDTLADECNFARLVDVTLTAIIYTDSRLLDILGAVEPLPSFGSASLGRNKAASTGTDDWPQERLPLLLPPAPPSNVHSESFSGNLEKQSESNPNRQPASEIIAKPMKKGQNPY